MTDTEVTKLAVTLAALATYQAAVADDPGLTFESWAALMARTERAVAGGDMDGDEIRRATEVIAKAFRVGS